MTSDEFAWHYTGEKFKLIVKWRFPSRALRKGSGRFFGFRWNNFGRQQLRRQCKYSNNGTREGVAVDGRSTDRHSTHRTGLFVLCSIAGMRFKCLLHLCFSVVFDSLRRFELCFAGLAEAQSNGSEFDDSQITSHDASLCFASNSRIYGDCGKRQETPLALAQH